MSIWYQSPAVQIVWSTSGFGSPPSRCSRRSWAVGLSQPPRAADAVRVAAKMSTFIMAECLGGAEEPPRRSPPRREAYASDPMPIADATPMVLLPSSEDDLGP